MRRTSKPKRSRNQPKEPQLTFSKVADGLIGIVIGAAIVIWFFSGMISSCASWLP